MNSKELKELIAEGESSLLEFKRKISSHEKIAKEISALANTIGGTLILGVDDDGSIVGIESEKSDLDSIEQVCGFMLQPPVEFTYEIVNVSRKEVLVIYIPQGSNKPHRVIENPKGKKNENKVYIRIGEKSLVASREMSRFLASQNEDAPPLQISIGEREKRFFAYLEKYERATVKDFAKLVNISERRSERILIKLVRAGVLQIHVDSERDYFTLV
jgi:predicted HTH transcriptional regulator